MPGKFVKYAPMFLLLPLICCSEVAERTVAPSVAGSAPAATENEPAPVGTVETPESEGTGFYRVERIEGVWWIISPDGSPVWITGIQAVGAPDANKLLKNNLQKKYPSGKVKIYLRECLDQVVDWGFNSVGIGSPCLKILPKYNNKLEKAGGSRLGYFEILGVSRFGRVGTPDLTERDFWLRDRTGAHVHSVKSTCFPDPFNEEWRELIDRQAETRVTSLRNDRDLIGYFVDNETGFEGIYRSVYSSAASMAFIDWLRSSYGSINELNKTWGTGFGEFESIIAEKPDPDKLGSSAKKDFLAFERVIVKKYVDFTVAAIRKYDPNHLVISNRFAIGQDPLFKRIKAAGDKYLDIFSAYDIIALNLYPVNNKPYYSKKRYEILDYYFRKTGRPILISEFGMGSRESGIKPSKSWAHRYLDTDRDRGKMYGNILPNLVRLPYTVGLQWFTWGNRYGQENMPGGAGNTPRNCGVVDDAGVPYPDLVKAMKKVNSGLDAVKRNP